MPTYRAVGVVTGSKYLGEFTAPTEAAAEQAALESYEASVSLCHQCADECEDPAIEEVHLEQVDPPPTKAKKRKVRPSLEDFKAHMNARLDAFAAHWAEEHEVTPKAFPETLPKVSDWEDQFRAFMGWDE